MPQTTVSSSSSVIHHPLFPSLLATHSVNVADGHRHYKSASSQPSTITSEDIKKKLTESGENSNNNNNNINNNNIQNEQQNNLLINSSTNSTLNHHGGDHSVMVSAIPIQQDETSVVNQLCHNFLVQANYPSVVESEIPSMVMNSQPSLSSFDHSICGLAAITALHKLELQTMYNLCEDFIDQMQHTLHIEKQHVKFCAKQRIQHPNVYGSNAVFFGPNYGNGGGTVNNHGGNGVGGGVNSGSGGGGVGNSLNYDSFDPFDASPNLALDQHPNGSDDGLGDDDGDYPLAEIKKTEDVVKELKKRYSGEVLTLAKKKKNFSKSATDVLNVWFFQHLHGR